VAEDRKIVYNVEVRTGDAKPKIDELAKSMDGLGKSMDDLSKKRLDNKDMNALHNAKVVQGVRSYSSELGKLNMACEKLYRTYRDDPSAANLASFAATRRALLDTEREYARYQSRVEGTGVTLKEFERKAMSHFTWITTGAAISAMASIPAEITDTIARIDADMASIRQVIPEIEANPQEAGTEEFTQQQQRMNKAMDDYIAIAARYGATTQEVMEAPAVSAVCTDKASRGRNRRGC